MSHSFTKLFSSITESTVWSESPEIRVVWITMLAMCDYRGMVWASIPGLARRANVSVEITRQAIQSFLLPDPDSRTKDFDGRRIEEIDGGWRLLNYKKYREIRSEEERKEYQREWDRTKRVRPESDRIRQNPTNPTKAEVEVEVEVEVEKEKTKDKEIGSIPTRPKFIKPTVQSITDYAIQIGYSLNPERFYDHYEACGWKIGNKPMKDWRAAVRNWQRRDNEKNGKKKSIPGDPDFKPTDTDRVILAYRQAMEIPDSDRKNWNAMYWEENKPIAEKLLSYFDGKLEVAIDCVAHFVAEFRSKGFAVTLDTVRKHAAEFKHRSVK